MAEAEFAPASTHCPPRIIVDPAASVDTGGPEALVQLTLAFAATCRHATFSLGPTIIHPRFYQEYPGISLVPKISLNELQKGDIVVSPDVVPCNQQMVQRGVHWYTWILSSSARRHNWRTLQLGCRLISHNHWLAHDTLAGISLQKQWVLHPYISPSITRMCAANSNITTRRRLVLLDSDSPDQVEEEVERACASLGCQSVRVARKPRAQVMGLLTSAMIVVDWTMVGSERMPIEAVLCGAVLLTSASRCGQDAEDFPIPRHSVLAHPQNLSFTIAAILSNFALEQRLYRHMRQKYYSLGERSLQREVAVFLSAHASTASIRRYKDIYAPSSTDFLEKARLKAKFDVQHLR